MLLIHRMEENLARFKIQTSIEQEETSIQCFLPLEMEIYHPTEVEQEVLVGNSLSPVLMICRPDWTT